FVCTHILTVRTQVFLFKANYGTAVPCASFFMPIHKAVIAPTLRKYTGLGLSRLEFQQNLPILKPCF
ncbi:hypothetical protein, partial [Acinetobacter indicus]